MDRKSKLIHAAGRSYAAKEMRQYFGFDQWESDPEIRKDEIDFTLAASDLTGSSRSSFIRRIRWICAAPGSFLRLRRRPGRVVPASLRSTGSRRRYRAACIRPVRCREY